MAQFPFASRSNAGAEAPVAGGEVAGTIVEKDVEAPDVFAANDSGLWDGRPSLGGVWVAHPDVADPERVIIRNEANGNFVIGALFRRERENPGPRIQVSSDAASELGMLAGQPTTLDVIALRRETVEVPAEIPAEDLVAEDPEAVPADAIETASLDPVAAASAAIDDAEATAPTAQAEPEPVIEVASVAPAAASAAPEPVASGDLKQPFIQIGIFSVEKNAENTATSLRNAGLIPTVRQQEARGKEFWRVIVGPATNTSERSTILAKVRELGFSDAYYVNN